MPTLLSVPAACEDLGGISRTTLWTLVRAGYLEQVNIGRRSFIVAKSLAAFVKSLSESADDDTVDDPDDDESPVSVPVPGLTVPRRQPHRAAQHEEAAT